VVTYGGRIGHFSSITGIDAGGNLSYAAVYLSNALRLTVARPGDANLDRTVGFADLVTVAQHYGTTDQDWSTGDFTGDGVVNFQDLVTIAQNYGAGSQLAAIPGATPAFYQDWATISAPEPAAANVLLTLASLRLLCRKRKVA